jgi:tRNA(adenine34) deaminase
MLPGHKEETTVVFDLSIYLHLASPCLSVFVVKMP